MIVSRIFSGLGNQMFQYSIARSLALRNKTGVLLDTSSFFNDKLREYGLHCFDLKCNLISNFKVPFINKIGWDFLKLKHFKFNYYTDPIWSFNDELNKDRSKFISISGYWAWPKYFENISPIIKNDFKLKEGYEIPCKRWIDTVRSNNSVSIHIRRTDYITDPHAVKFFGVLPITYYLSAVDYIKNHVKDPVFYLFSDDIQWVKNKFISETGIDNYQLVEDKRLSTPAQELIIMSSCKHNIISNSTFGWWAAWLNQNHDKIVIMPKIWYQDSTAQQAYQKGILNINTGIWL